MENGARTILQKLPDENSWSASALPKFERAAVEPLPGSRASPRLADACSACAQPTGGAPKSTVPGRLLGSEDNPSTQSYLAETVQISYSGVKRDKFTPFPFGVSHPSPTRQFCIRARLRCLLCSGFQVCIPQDGEKQKEKEGGFFVLSPSKLGFIEYSMPPSPSLPPQVCAFIVPASSASCFH